MEKNAHQSQPSEGMNVKLLFLKFLPFWPLFLITTVISVSYFYVKLKYTVPVFESTTSVMIRDEKKGQEESKMEDQLNVFEPKKIVENEIEVFRSNSIISEAVKALNLYSNTFKERGWMGMATTPAFLSSPINVEVQNPDSILIKKKEYYSYSPQTHMVLMDGKEYPLNQWIKFPWSTIRFVENPYYDPKKNDPGEKYRFYFTLTDVNAMTKNVIARLTVTPTSKQSSVITITLKDPIPDRAQLTLREIVTAYKNAAVDRKNQVANRTLKFIEDRLEKVSKELDSVESGIQNYRDRTGVVDITEQSRAYLDDKQTNDRQLSTLNLQLSALDEVEKYVESKSNEGSIVPSTFNIQDPQLSSLLEKLYTAQAQYEKLRRTSGENNPSVVALRDEIDKIRPGILDNIRNQKATINSNISYLQQSNQKYEGMLSTIPKKEKDLVEVSRLRNIKADIYSFLLQKREETSYSISSILPDCYIVSEPTTSPSPVSPKKTFIALLALVLPIGGSVGLVLLKDLFNNKILYRSDIEKYTDFPVIGEVIFDKNQPTIVTEGDSRSFIVEQFRQIRATLKYQGNPPGLQKRILTTSCVKGEGKSFISTNLAMSLARSGKKVALLELDLHQPQISNTFDLDIDTGITQYLEGKATIDSIIVPSGRHENLFILPAGRLADEPSELLVNGRLENLLNYLDGKFDTLVIDTAPFKALTDAFTIAHSCNLVLVVIRHNHTPIKLIERINEDMESHRINNVAIIFNAVKNRGLGKYSYGYGYGYGYDQKSAYSSYYSKKMKKVS